MKNMFVSLDPVLPVYLIDYVRYMWSSYEWMTRHLQAPVAGAHTLVPDQVPGPGDWFPSGSEAQVAETRVSLVSSNVTSLAMSPRRRAAVTLITLKRQRLEMDSCLVDILGLPLINTFIAIKSIEIIDEE